ncbi:MAG: MBL fold metallo-hydrolase [Tissierellia bacterium]|nr:MBL fold metallo-hydrolase [Tissierellia bacterium]
MKRPWFLWGLIMFLCCFSKITGMEIVFIPLFVLLFILFPSKTWIVMLLILLRLFLPAQEIQQEQGLCQLRKISPLKNDMVLSIEGRRYILKNFEGEEGLYKGDFTLEEFSEKRSPSGFCEKDYYNSLGFKARGLQWRGEALEVKPFLLTIIRQKIFDRAAVFGEYQGLAYSLVFGLKEGLSPDEKTLFSSIGLMHLFVVSGLHLGIYYRSCLYIVKHFGGPHICGEILGLSLIFFFCCLSDFHVSSVRTFLIYILESIAFHRKKKLDPLEAMGFVGFFLLFYRPSYATSFSFILGTLSYGILRVARVNSLIFMYVLMFPLQLIFVSEIKILYYLVNSLLAGLMVVILPILMLGFVFSFLAQAVGYLFTALMGSLEFVNKIPWAWHFTPPGWLSLFVFYGFLFAGVLARENKEEYFFIRSKKSIGIFLFLFLVLFQFENSYRRFGLHFLDVGQGDSSLLITDSGKTLLIDTGRGRAIHEHLQSLGIYSLDMVIITHFDEDHSKELNKLHYKKLYYPKGSHYPQGYPLEEGDVIQIDDVSLRFISPAELRYDDNEDCLVFVMNYKGKKILYTGDVGIKRLKELPRERVDILKYPHHGSRHSLERSYYDAVDPQIVILSYGRNNYGHPHPEVMQYLEPQFKVFETFNDGSLHLKNRGYRSY